MKNSFSFKGKLQVNKEVISKLQDSQLLDVIGGKGAVGMGCSNGAACSCTKQSCPPPAMQ